MPKLTFNQFIGDNIGTVQSLEDVRSRIEKAKERHQALGFGSLVDADFAATDLTKAEYDALVLAFVDFLTWWNTNRTALETVLIQTP